MATYYYNQQANLSCSELFFWIAVDKTMEQLGVKDVGAVFAILAGQPIIPTRAKVAGATKGTSVASIVSRRILNYDLKVRLPMLTGASIKTLRIALTKNLGAFVGRSVPVVGWLIVANDVVRITWNTVTTYNAMVSPEDRLAP
ncbi:MAG: hypothetical protein PHR30_14965 [Gallionellaceae bacterium]|nr:hypothetical protein [Gallionellaceae bacterium]